MSEQEAKETVTADVPVVPENGQPAAVNSGGVVQAAAQVSMVESIPESQTATSQDKTVMSSEGDNAVLVENVAASAETKPNGDAPGELVHERKNHSKFRVIIHGVYKFEDQRQVKKTAASWFKAIQEKSPELKLELHKVKKPPKENWTVLTMKDESMVQPLIDYINNNRITNRKGFQLNAKISEESEGWDDRKRKDVNSSDGGDNKRQRTKPPARRPVTQDEIRSKVTPLWKLSEEEQRDTKTKEMVRRCAMKTVQEIKGRFRALDRDKNRDALAAYNWVQQKRCIEVDALITAPTPLRNKSEFTFGYHYLFDETKAAGDDSNKDDAKDNDTTEKDYSSIPAVGFMVTGWSGGVSSPHCCANIPSEVCAIADLLNAFLPDSPLPPYDAKVHTGFWRTVTIRSSRRTKECMVIIVHAPPVSQDGSVDHSEHLEKEKTRLISLLTTAELPVDDQTPLKVTSIFFQEFGGLSQPPPEHPIQHLYGKTSLHEQLGKCTFQISPGAFFQVNTPGAEMLYKLVVDKVREVSPNPEDTLLFDVCCGTGTIGLTCMKEGAVGSVIGVDISAPAIEDAIVNAKLNGFGPSEDGKQKTRFIAARAEQVLHQEIIKAKKTNPNQKFVAVVDPAREGLHADVVRALRANERIGRIVYVSCNPTATLVRDAGLLCGPPTKRYSGEAFRVVSSSPVDMFPLTNHCEMVMTFDRLSVNVGTETESKTEDATQTEVKKQEATVKTVDATQTEVKKGEGMAEVEVADVPVTEAKAEAS